MKITKLSIVTILLLGIAGCRQEGESVNRRADDSTAEVVSPNDDHAPGSDSSQLNSQAEKQFDLLTFKGLGISIAHPERLEITNISHDNGDEIVEFNSHSLKVSGGTVFFDGEKFGTIKSGQRITISHDQILSIRDEPKDQG